MEAELRLIVADAVGLPLALGKRMPISSLVLELQEQALNPNASITGLLRKVKVAAAKLGLNDILEWVTFELDGYPNDDDVIPDYRQIRGIAKGLNPLRGWLKIEFENPELEKRVSTQKSPQPISEIEALAEISDGALAFVMSSAFTKGVLSHATDARIFVARSQIIRILDAVRNRVLNWALALERQGILGEGVSFSSDEKTQASNSDFHFEPHYTVHGNVGVIGDLSESIVKQSNGASMDSLARALQSLSDVAVTLEDSRGIVVAAAAERAVTAAGSARPNITLVERLIGGMSALVQGIGALGPAWTAVTTEAARLGLHFGQGSNP
jgi:hypothetical protein